MRFTPQELAAFDWLALQRRCRGEVVDLSRVVFYGTPRPRIERSYEELADGYADRVFLKVNRIAESGL